MKTSTIVTWIVVILIILFGGWYWWSSMQAQPGIVAPVAPTSAPTTTETPVVAPTLDISATSTLGNYLVAQNGMTLYYYTKDTPGVSNCTGTCAVAWPPYTVASSTTLAGAAGITEQISTLTRADGSLQVTYNGAPLYFWHNDVNVGDTNGQGVGGTWFVVKP